MESTIDIPAPPADPLALVETQLAEAAAIARMLSAWAQLPSCSLDTVSRLAGALATVLNASASLTRAAGALRRGESQSCHRVIVERAAPEGEGVRPSRKRIGAGDT